MRVLRKVRERGEEEEEKGEDPEEVDDEDSQEDDEEIDLPYPEECRVLDIMRDKYQEAVRFFTDTNDKKQSALAIKEF